MRKAKNDEARNKNIQKEIREAKDNWLGTKYREIEALEQKCDSFNMHKKDREAAGIYRSNTSGTIHNEDGKMITDVKQKMNT